MLWLITHVPAQAPLCLVLVPTRELGVQIVMLVYKLFGGSVNAGVPGESSNMFAFTGPRGLKVGCIAHAWWQPWGARLWSTCNMVKSAVLWVLPILYACC